MQLELTMRYKRLFSINNETADLLALNLGEIISTVLLLREGIYFFSMYFFAMKPYRTFFLKTLNKIYIKQNDKIPEHGFGMLPNYFQN